jgi:hypothetical protein
LACTLGPASFGEGNAEFGGYLKRLLFDGGVAQTFLRGPESPVLRLEEADLKAGLKDGKLTGEQRQRLDELQQGGKDLNIPVTVRWTEGAGQATVEVQGQKLTLKAGEWSEWVPLAFKVNFLLSLHGMTQFYVVQAGRELQLYASPVNLDPRDPPLPLSKPDGFSARLAKEIGGPYRTLGWAESADKALQEGRLDEGEPYWRTALATAPACMSRTDATGITVSRCATMTACSWRNNLRCTALPWVRRDRTYAGNHEG